MTTAKTAPARKTAAAKAVSAPETAVSVPMDVVAVPEYNGTLKEEHAFGRALLNYAWLTEVPEIVEHHDARGEVQTALGGYPVMVPNTTGSYYQRQLAALVDSI